MTSYAFVIVGLSLIAATPASAAERLRVKIIDRQVSDTSYGYIVPGSLTAQSNSSSSCFGSASSVNCGGAVTTTGSVMPPRQVAYQVRGATFALKLPDGRIVVVNCESKYAPKGDFINRRSCRIPLVDDIQAEFDGDKAKLTWPVSLDGKKMESETYKILGVLKMP